MIIIPKKTMKYSTQKTVLRIARIVESLRKRSLKFLKNPRKDILADLNSSMKVKTMVLLLWIQMEKTYSFIMMI